ncbi:potassium channel family protein [Streptomyces abikoensis]|uniref:potassium channel family protein n=1 Tax=Streptomyces abikoensis TaxID=97398 RepID=UPI0019BFEE41|nr:potassium channel family protein [Streptomyces abikoensis]GGP47069.1 metal transporter [Streptomyces abikoensis]
MTGRRPPVGAIMRPLATATALVLAYYLLPMDKRFTGVAAVTLVLGLAALLLLFVRQLRSISASSRPRLRAVETLATTVPLFLLIFATTYYLLERNVPGSFSEHLDRTGALYFTLTVFSTVGFGDIVATSASARIVTTAQMVADVLLVGVAARVVVGAVETGLRRREAPPAPAEDA